MDVQFIAVAQRWLRQSTSLPPGQRRALAALTPSLLNGLPRTPRAVGIAGPPGTGKSTLARMLCAVLEADGTSAAVLSLDDYYLPKAQRQRLAQEIHPLLAIRGIPGTHDLDLLLDHLDRLLTGAVEGLILPKFDKSEDERCATGTPWTGPAPQVLFLEGWCIGCPAPPKGTEDTRVRGLGPKRDADHHWQDFLLRNLSGYAQHLNPKLAERWFLAAPDWQSVINWRWQQEQQQERPRLENPAAVTRFLATYEPLCQFMLETCQNWASRVIRLDADHCPES